MTARTRKQNRILTAILTILSAVLIALAALTAGANRRAKSEENPAPPVGNRITDKAAEPSVPDRIRGNGKKTGELAEDAGMKVPETEKLDERLKPAPGKDAGAAEDASAAPAAVPVSADPGDSLPVFVLPLENAAAVKSCSLSVPVFSATMNDYRIHAGVDFAAVPGTPVLAAASGEVVSCFKDPMMGYTVVLAHDGGAVTRYKGLSEETAEIAKIGDKVTAGQIIGATGETALVESAEENHLHFELAVDGKNVDPADYIEFASLSDLYED